MIRLKQKPRNLHKERVFYADIQRRIDNVEKQIKTTLRKYNFDEREIDDISHTLRKLPNMERKNIDLLVLCYKYLTEKPDSNYIRWINNNAAIDLSEYSEKQKSLYYYSFYRYKTYIFYFKDKCFMEFATA